MDASSWEHAILIRLGIAAGFLFPGFISFLGGGCGVLIYHWFGEPTQPSPIKAPAAESCSSESPADPGSGILEHYVLVESPVNPLAPESAPAKLESRL